MFRASRATLRLLISRACDLQEYQILGGESWVQTERFDIDAKPAAPSTKEQMNQMLQALLADRFALKFHRGSKDLELYVLSVAKNGPKFGPSFAFRSANTDEPPATVTGVAGQIPFRNVTIATFATYLRLNLSRDLGTGATINPQDVPPVLDKTGLEGTYDLVMSTAKEFDWSSLLERQLGLKLELRKIPVETLVIDSAARPDPNQ